MTASASHYDAVFFISFGGPEKSADIMPFLEDVTRGRGIPRARLEDVAHHYEMIGGGSPINAITRRQAEGLRRTLARSGPAWPVYIGQRHWAPRIEETLRQMAAEGIHRAIGFITAAHRCEASLERYVAAVERARAALGGSAPVIDYVNPWFDHPLFIDAIAARVQETLAQIPKDRQDELRWVFTAHSIPLPMANASPYVRELERTADGVAGKFGRNDWRLAYSSRSGNPRDPWLEPDVSDLIRAEARRGVREILFIPIGFLADHVEVLFDLDVEAREAAQEAGVRLYRAGTVGDHPLFLEMMAEVVRERARHGETPEQRDSTRSVFREPVRR